MTRTELVNINYSAELGKNQDSDVVSIEQLQQQRARRKFDLKRLIQIKIAKMKNQRNDGIKDVKKLIRHYKSMLNGSNQPKLEQLIRDLERTLRIRKARASLAKQQQQIVKVFIACMIVRNVVAYQLTRSRSYRSPARSTFNTTGSHDDGGGGSESDSGDPPARRYHPLVILSKPKSNSLLLLLAVELPRQMSCGLSDGRRAI